MVTEFRQQAPTFAALAIKFFSLSVANHVLLGRENISSLCFIIFSAYRLI